MGVLLSAAHPPKPEAGGILLLSAGKKEEKDDLQSLSIDSSNCPMLKIQSCSLLTLTLWRKNIHHSPTLHIQPHLDHNVLVLAHITAPSKSELQDKSSFQNKELSNQVLYSISKTYLKHHQPLASRKDQPKASHGSNPWHIALYYHTAQQKTSNLRP